MYTADDFNTENAPKEVVQYVIDHVEGFENRYQRALSVIGRDRCPLRMADWTLYRDIENAIWDWTLDNDIRTDDYELPYTVEEIFG